MSWEITKEIEDSIIAVLENGESLSSWCRQPNRPSRATVDRYAERDTVFDERCRRAREIQGEMAAERLDDINNKLERGLIEPQAASVISSNLKWKSSKLFSRRYGEKQSLEVKHSGNITHSLKERQEAAMIEAKDIMLKLVNVGSNEDAIQIT